MNIIIYMLGWELIEQPSYDVVTNTIGKSLPGVGAGGVYVTTKLDSFP